jgi:DNA-binding transcriptional regulator LsrR (DeoR family)
VGAQRSQERLAEVAKLYYVDGLTQSEVARLMGTTRSNVSRMLQAARDQGVVRFVISHPMARQRQLEQALIETFRLSEALVLSADAGADLLQRTGELAARWLISNIKDGQTIALSWGRTLQALVEHVEVGRAYDITVLQLGGDLQLDQRLSGHELIRELAARLGGHYSYLHAPAVLDSSATAAQLRTNTNIAAQLDRARAADMALVGIGGYGHGFAEQIVRSAHLSASEQRQMEALQPAGDVCARFYDLDGNALDTPLRDRVLALDLDELRRIPLVVGIAAGHEKGRGVLGALRGDLVDVLICDQSVAALALHLEREDT